MYGESPQLKRCCFCLPLRRGLIGWGYFKLVVDVLSLIRFIVFDIHLDAHAPHYQRALIICTALIIFYAIDVIFSLVLIVGGHKKNHKLLRMSKIYNIVWLVPILILGGWLTYSDIALMYRIREMSRFYMVYLAVDLSLTSAIIFLQVYVILLTRSEEIKLRNESLGMQFVNNAAEGESLCVCTDHGHDVTIVH